MNRLMTTAMALALLSTSAAVAAPPAGDLAERQGDGPRRPHQERGDQAARQAQPDRPAPSFNRGEGDRRQPGFNGNTGFNGADPQWARRPEASPDQTQRQPQPGWNGRDGDRRPQAQENRDRNDGRGWSGQGWDGRGGDNRGWNNDARRGPPPQFRDRDRGRQAFRPDAFRRHQHAPRRFRAPAWRAPSGWFLRSWAFGDFLPRGWYAPSYYLNWGYYQLPPPPVGAEWVRNGPDALLVDVWSGEILSVYEGVFW